ncbi:LysR family transcriptional regulator [Arthrobacter dokdonensis]|uniref:LysR family transcriptional regulator n=1 Tax=Arthrobacter dokdonellae TaxID=2211210 RepID=UPI000DE5B90A|nr:LysR family transcriptional regulator [Arthrobacter dokdonellae]
MFTFDQLAAFIAVAEELHFGRAAERLNMTQPPLSRQIQKLEKTVGTALLERNNRKVSLTHAGLVFLDEARRLMTLANRAPVTARRIASGSSGILRVGFTATSGFSILGPLLDAISTQIPDLAVELFEQVTGEQIQGLQSGQLDVGLARPPFNTDEFDSRLLYRERMLLAVPYGHPLANLGRPLQDADLRAEALIMYSPTQARYFYDLVVRTLPVQHGNVVYSVSQILTMVSLVAAKRGIAFVPEAAKKLGVEGVVFLPLARSYGQPVELHAIWIKNVTNPALKRLLQDFEFSTSGDQWQKDNDLSSDTSEKTIP